MQLPSAGVLKIPDPRAVLARFARLTRYYTRGTAQHWVNLDVVMWKMASTASMDGMTLLLLIQLYILYACYWLLD